MTQLEETFNIQIRALKLPPPTAEYRFHPTRRWRFDYAWPEWKIAVEIEGGTFSKGRHTRGKGFYQDCIKYAEAAIAGWYVLRLDTLLVRSGEGVQLLHRLIKSHQI